LWNNYSMTLYDPGCAPSYTLTPRQCEMLQCAAEGMSNSEIATAFLIGERTVKAHLAQIRGRLGARNTTHAVYIAARLGLVRV
jgi:DNA-binding CsgD family transcriptional regulator